MFSMLSISDLDLETALSTKAAKTNVTLATEIVIENENENGNVASHVKNAKLPAKKNVRKLLHDVRRGKENARG